MNMPSPISAVLLLLAAACAVWLVLVYRGMRQDYLPQELKSARLVAVEEDLVVDVPYPVIGRPDRVYRLPNGQHVLLEFKTRAQSTVFPTDRAEISLRGWLLRRTGHPTAGHGYIVVGLKGSGVRSAHRVELQDDGACEAMVRRHIALLVGEAQARKSVGPKCRTCGHRARCEAHS